MARSQTHVAVARIGRLGLKTKLIAAIDKESEIRVCSAQESLMTILSPVLFSAVRDPLLLKALDDGKRYHDPNGFLLILDYV